MEESNKYYQPQLEEFCVGLEFEVLNKGVWVKDTFNCSSQFGFTFDDLPELRNISRVKLLDSQDIIDCGFGNKRKSVWDWYELDKHFRMRSGHHISKIKLIHDRSNEFIEITDGDICPNIKIWGDFCGTNECLFEGIIKNKHELKTILRQVGVL